MRVPAFPSRMRVPVRSPAWPRYFNGVRCYTRDTFASLASAGTPGGGLATFEAAGDLGLADLVDFGPIGQLGSSMVRTHP